MNSPYPPSGSTPLNRIKRRIDMEQLKMPLGFLRLVELGFTIVVLAAISGWEFELRYTCKVDGTSIKKNMTLPGLDLEKDNFIRKCDGNSTVNPFEDFSVGIGPGLVSYLIVATLFFAVSTTLLYVLNYAAYVSDNRLPTLDLAITIVLAFGWLLGTFAFSLGVGRIEKVTDKKYVMATITELDLCAEVLKNKTKCEVEEITSYAMYATLNVAVLAGCALVLLFFANIWFCYKETAAFRARQSHNQMLHQMQQEPYTLE